ncbi:hypothetical protein DXA92_05780 [Agathobaculum butyriciproducens]|nr:hypothetical protein DXA94_11245 [Agathobaculum butyriciproducens]RGC61841.1 hypothetical protein DXA92_05780 [Agathobaculum butyriciproducens]
MPIYLTEQYAKAVEKLYTHTSFLRPHCKAHVDMIGKKTCKVYQILTSDLNDYKREGKDRYGVPNDVQDIVHEYTITQDKAFTAIVDKGDGSQQAISNKAGQYLRQQISEKCVPTGDKYGFSRIARFGHILGVAAAPTKSDIISTIYDAAAYMDDHYVPDDGRILFVRVSDYKKIILSDEWVKLDNLAGKQLPTGVVGQVAGFTVVKVPDRLFPTDVYMLAIHEQALAFPYTIDDTKIHTDPPGVSGSLVEGRQIYDLFVLSSRADSVVVVAKAASKQACTVAIASHSATVMAEGSDEIWYTLDGSDPRFSANRMLVASGGTVATKAGETIKVVAFGKGGKLTSDVAEATDK